VKWQRLLWAAALVARSAAPQEVAAGDAPEARDVADTGGAPRDGEPRRAQAGASAQITTSARGGREMLVLAHLHPGGVRLAAGAESLSGPLAPERRGIVARAEIDVGDDGEAQVEAHLLPEQDEVWRASAEAWVRIGWLGAGVLARRTTLGPQRLDAIGAGVVFSWEMLGIESEARLAGWRIDLAASRGRDPWTAFGQRTLDWAERWQAEVSGRRPLGRVAITAAASVSQSASPQLSGRGSAGIEVKIGPAVLSAALAVARAPDGFAPEITAGAELWAP
jgi:hypothetical protein